MNIRLLLLILTVFCFSQTAKASHIMGGEISWRCSGNGYIFDFVLYRNCNEADVNTASIDLKVWNHPAITSITLPFLSREDISPSCTQVPGGPTPLLCGNGSGAGNGNGAIEKVTYRSAVIILPGIPPAGTGWVFTYEDAGLRNGSITNLVDADTKGITVVAKMFGHAGSVSGVCRDNSPKFLQNPYLVSCAGEDFNYSMNAVDIDLDTLLIAFAQPFDKLNGAPYNPPANPAPIAFETGFSVTSPTPDASFDAGNIPAQINPHSGELTFHSNTIGNFVIKCLIKSYRNGALIAEVEREIQVISLNCASAPGAPNTPPDITPPFGTGFETTVDAGTLVNFTIAASDPENLQDGSPQNNTLSASGLMFGTNFTSATGCINAPCATLNQTPPVISVQGASVQFNWQTDCSHTETQNGEVLEVIPYHFIFKVQDNYCQVPKTTFRTVTINVRNPGLLPASQITCISTAANGAVTIAWEQAVDPLGTFVEYRLNSVQDGLLGTFPIGTTTATLPAPGSAKDYFVTVVSGCNANALRNSDTLRNVFLTVQNPANGTAKLLWNLPADVQPATMGGQAIIEREYPAGIWSAVGTVNYGVDEFFDTIDICNAFLNYRITYTMPNCAYTSNIAGGQFEDMLTPDIPAITSVSIDTITGNVVIIWNQNSQPDTYGYVIYIKDPTGPVTPIDTVWGMANTTYTYTIPVDGPLTYTVAAFDSCFTDAVPPTYQTSAKADLHTTMYLTHTLDICNDVAKLSWTPYLGWGNNLGGYTIFMRAGSGSWQQVGTTASTTFEMSVAPQVNYCFVIRAKRNGNGAESFSNIRCFTLNGPNSALVHYLRVATVEGNTVVLRHEIETGTNVKSVVFQKYNPRNGLFEDLATIPATASTLTFTDVDADVQNNSYKYRSVVIDSCGRRGAISNQANTILLKVTTDQTGLKNYLSWTPYSVFDGGVFKYHVYRSVDGVFSPVPIESMTSDRRYYEDDVTEYGEHSGQFCYLIAAEEGNNQYGIKEQANSNTVCAAVVPLVYIPNAIFPDGINKIFLPVVSFADVQKYEMVVLDRWGSPIFETKDINEGWDGTHPLTGKLVELGLYSYVVKVMDGNNQEYVYRGHVTVIR